jgi:hypothetical protein
MGDNGGVKNGGGDIEQRMTHPTVVVELPRLLLLVQGVGGEDDSLLKEISDGESDDILTAYLDEDDGGDGNTDDGDEDRYIPAIDGASN